MNAQQQFTGRTYLRLSRLTGLAGILGGVLLAALDIAFIVFFGDQPERVAAATPVWLILLDLSLVATYLEFVALIGFYSRLAEKSGWFGLFAFVVASFGTLMSAGFNWAGGFIVPALTSAAPEFLDQVAESPPAIVAAGFISTFVLHAIGWLLFGITLRREKTFTSIPAWLLIIGAVVGLVSRIAGLGIPGVLFGAALAWLGWQQWKA